MRKYIFIASFLLLAVFVSSCIREYEEPNAGADISWFIAGREANNYEPLMIEVDEYFGFMDTSLGAVSHAWEIKGDGCYLITEDPDEMDWMASVNPEVPEITDDSPYATDETTIAVLFKEEGLKAVRLVNYFDKPVTHYYTRRGSSDATTIYENNSVYVDGQYMIDTTIYVKVFSSTIVADAKVYTDPELTQEVETGYNEDGSLKSIEILYGETLYFVDNSYYEPDTWEWTCTSAGIGNDTPLTGNVVGIQFNMLKERKSETTTPFRVTLTASRDAETEGQNVDTPVGKSVPTQLPLGIYVNPNERALNPEFRLAPTDRRTVKVILDNTSFDETYFEKSASGDVSVAEQYAEILKGIKLNRVAANGASQTIDCTDVEVGLAANGESANVLNIRFGAEGEAPLYTTDSSIKLVISGDALPTALGSGYSIEAGSYDVDPYLYDNLLPDMVGDLNLLYDTLCDKCGLDSTRDDAIIAANNENIYFRAELYSVFHSLYDDTNNETAVFTLVRDPFPDTTYGDANDMCIKVDVKMAGACRLRVGTEYNFDAYPGMYYYTMKIATDPTNYPTMTSSMATTAAICEPLPSDYTVSSFLDGSTTLYYYSKTNFANSANQWLYTYDLGYTTPKTASSKGYDLSFALIMTTYQPGYIVYLKDFKITNAY